MSAGDVLTQPERRVEPVDACAPSVSLLMSQTLPLETAGLSSARLHSANLTLATANASIGSVGSVCRADTQPTRRSVDPRLQYTDHDRPAQLVRPHSARGRETASVVPLPVCAARKI